MAAPIYLVAGARPNFIKLAPLVWVLNSRGDVPFHIVHTGQHYDHAMSQSFFDVLNIPEPEINLEVGSGTQSLQTARILERFDGLLQEKPPSAVVVFGDVNSTLACSLAAAKRLIPVVHVEAGLRSFDRSMPEEINRLVTDALSDLLLVSENSGLVHLKREGIADDKVRLVGNIMIDSLVRMLPKALKRQTATRLGVEPGQYALLTLHRPSNVDDPATFVRLLNLFSDLSRKIPIIFPVHPRTQNQIGSLGYTAPASFRLVEPVDYLDSLCLQKQAKLVLTDSGGIQEETSCLSIPCLTLRQNTERPVTVELGTSTIVGNNESLIRETFELVLAGRYKPGRPIPLWDGHTAERVADSLQVFLGVH
ncbi:MAG: UDP-N-acetylglucosamine 2-epimerase (non-hydrolyzing) [Anaerolineales bacterium]